VRVEHHKWYSHHLGQDMQMKVYGHYGKPVLVFPCAGGSFHEFEDLGMKDAIAGFIHDGKIKVFTVDSVDNQSWLKQDIWPGDRGRRHNDYDRYLTHEVVPFIHNHIGGTWGITTSGCSMGAYHAVNYLLRHPDIIDSTIAMSGIYSMVDYMGWGCDQDVYYNSPADALPGLNDEWFLEHLRNSRMFIGVGQGAWEDECLRDTRRLGDALHSKGIPAWIDIWGHDVNHDWPWWYKMMPHFLNHLVG
jgi:esterase/lipase superfamily enzyme